MLPLKFNKAALLLLLIGMAVYFNSLGNGFVWDDKYLVEDNQFIRTLSGAGDIFSHHLFYFSRLPVLHYYRPLQALSYLVDYQVWGLNPLGYHLTNILLHILNALLVFYFVKLLWKDGRRAFIAALIFLVHPLHNAAVGYVAGRADLLAAACILASLICFAKYLLNGERPLFLYLLSIGLFFLALLAKESGLLLLLLLMFVFPLAGRRDGARPISRLAMFIVPFIIIGAAFTLHNFWVSEDIYSPQHLFDFSPQKLLTWVKTVFIYIGLFFVPINLHMERATPIVSSIFSSQGIILLFGLAALPIFTVFVFRRSKISFFGWGWFLLTISSVYFSVYFNADLFKKNLAIMAEHWMYLPIIGAGILLVDQWCLVNERLSGSLKRLINIFGVAILIFFCAQTVRMNYVWQDDTSLFKNTLRFAPYSHKPYVLLGKLYLRQGRLDEAIGLYLAGIRQNPESASLYTNLGMAYERKKEFAAAKAAYQKAVAIDPRDFYAQNNLGVILANSGRLKEARECWRRSFEANPNFELANQNLALTFKNDRTIKRYNAQLNKNPDDPSVLKELAGYYLSCGLYPEAIIILQKCVAIYPDDALAYNMLGYISVRLRYFKQAEKYFKQAIRASPDYLEPYNNLGALYATMGKPAQAKAIWEKALEIDPNASLIRDNLNNLKGKSMPH